MFTRLVSPSECAFAVALAACLGLVTPAVAAAAQDNDPSADEIVARVLERGQRQSESGVDLAFESTVESVVENLDGDLQVEKTELETYRQYPLEGVLYEELIARDGEPLTADETRDELERKEDFAQDVRERVEKGEDPEPEDENRVEFDDEFTSRFQFTVESEEIVNGHRCWVLYLEPREGDLPVRRNIDRALNKSTGRIWVAQDDYGVARVEFEMAESVRIWGGLLGTLRNATGRMEYTRIANDIWLPGSMDIHIDLRILFRNVRRRFVREWGEYVPAPDADQDPSDVTPASRH